MNHEEEQHSDRLQAEAGRFFPPDLATYTHEKRLALLVAYARLLGYPQASVGYVYESQDGSGVRPDETCFTYGLGAAYHAVAIGSVRPVQTVIDLRLAQTVAGVAPPDSAWGKATAFDDPAEAQRYCDRLLREAQEDPTPHST